MENENKSASNNLGEAKSDNEWNDFERSLEVLLRNRRKGDSASESSTSEHPPLGSPATLVATTPLSRTAVVVQPASAAPTGLQVMSSTPDRQVQRRPASAGLPATITSGSLRPSFTSPSQQGSRFRAPLSYQPRPPLVHIPSPTSFVPVRVGIPPPSYPYNYLPLPTYSDQFVYPYYTPITTPSYAASVTQNSFSTYPISGPQQGQATPTVPSPDNNDPPYCELCPSPSPFNEGEVGVHNSSHEVAMFQCAGCGYRLASYSLMESHVEVEHVGNDSELIKASIVIPGQLNMLKMFQCGIKTCSRKFVALPEGDLRKHIGETHGEFYIHMGKGRNIVRLCRICPEEKRFATDEDLMSHILVEHPLSIYANGESQSILPGSQKIPVLLNRHPQPLARHSSPLRRTNNNTTKRTEEALTAVDDVHVPNLNKSRSIKENRKITMLRKTPVRDPDGSIINDRKRKRVSRRHRHEREPADSTTDDNNGHEKSSKRRRRSETKDTSKKTPKKKKRKEMSLSLSLSPEDTKRKRKYFNIKENSERKSEMLREMRKESITEKESHKSPFKLKASQIKSFIKKKSPVLATSKEVYCEACNCFTSDWSDHQNSLRHTKNDKKSRCFFCPDRFWFPQLKNHVSTHHQNNSFICNAALNCNIRLMELHKMVDHINTKHQRQLEPLYAMMPKNYISPGLLTKHGILFHPDDLRKFTCQICSCQFLAQDRKAIIDHFTLAHQHLKRHQQEELIIYECRACESTLFGSETHLNNHIRKAHKKDPEDKRQRIKEEGGLGLAYSPLPSFRLRDQRSRNLDLIPERTSYHQGRDCGDSRKPTIAPNVVQRFKTNFEYNSFSSKPSKNDEMKPRTFPRIPESNVASSQSQVLNCDTFESCPFCDEKLFSSDQRQHQQDCHSDLLFSCDNFCTWKFKSAWKNDVLSHLKDDHNKVKSDEMLMRHYLRLPSNLKMVCCKISSCDAAVFLGKSPKEMDDKMNLHVNEFHIGKTMADCFNLACRSCSFVLPLDQENIWLEHLALNHKTKDFYTNQIVSLVGSHTPSDDTNVANGVNNVDIKKETPTDEENVHTIKETPTDEENVHIIKETRTGEQSNIKSEENKEIMSDEDKSNILFEEGQCSFCTKTLLKSEEPRHVLEHHLNKLFHCQVCDYVGEQWTSFSVEELTQHFSTCHIDMECKVSAPPDGDVVMSVCSVCTAQFYTLDPAVLATHLANHEIGINLKLFNTFCRMCGMNPEDNIEKHFKTAHAEEYRMLVDKINKTKKEDFDVKQKDNSENEVGNDLKTDASKHIKVVKVKHNPKVKWKIIDLKEKQLKGQKKLKETSSTHDKKTCLKYEHSFDQNDGDLLDKEVKQNCLYCLKELKLTSLPFHVLTQHKKLTFRCNICVDSKINKLPNKICFDTLDAAGEHMDQAHNIDLKKIKDESMERNEAEIKNSCPIKSLLEVFCPGLSIPVDLRKRECRNCGEKLVSLSSVERHNQICPKSEETKEGVENPEEKDTRENQDNYQNYKLSCRLCEAYFGNEEQFKSHLK